MPGFSSTEGIVWNTVRFLFPDGIQWTDLHCPKEQKGGTEERVGPIAATALGASIEKKSGKIERLKRLTCLTLKIPERSDQFLVLRGSEMASRWAHNPQFRFESGCATKYPRLTGLNSRTVIKWGRDATHKKRSSRCETWRPAPGVWGWLDETPAVGDAQAQPVQRGW